MSATIERRFYLATQGNRRGGFRRVLQPGETPEVQLPVVAPPVLEVAVPSHVHPLARRMAMAITCLRLLQSGAVSNAAALSSLAGTTKARMTQVLNLTLLAPDIQEALVHLPVECILAYQQLRPLITELCWNDQRILWSMLQSRIYHHDHNK